MGKKTKEQIHTNMSHVKNSDTALENALCAELIRRGIKSFSRNARTIIGKPDIAFSARKIAIFCDSEFFHGKDWEVLKPRLEKGNNSQYWVSKIARNRERDDEINKRLLFEGWTVIRFWGKDISDNVEECIKVIEEAIWDERLLET